MTLQQVLLIIGGVALAGLLFGCSSDDTPPHPGDAAVREDAVTADATASHDLALPDSDTPDASSGMTGFGDPCTVGGEKCPSELFCLVGPSSGTNGFCTKTCPAGQSKACTGTPPGTSAYCIVTDVNPQGDKGCAFVCEVGGMKYICPGSLKCSSSEDPPGSGQHLCLP